ncbi:hypothetical protein Mgra_00000946 [Meloidogyne graminicola]|uniref:Uncharacterized protein n=1 Tax=Meloidogyne graminicola TaxID=189291 RepID=A0A8T0A0R2_9BILA|nr:hypothetical protein Mgra_00000946 [Meloidogyne graminicola]
MLQLNRLNNSFLLFSLFIFAISFFMVTSTPLYGSEMSFPQYYRAIWNINSKRSRKSVECICLALSHYQINVHWPFTGRIYGTQSRPRSDLKNIN